MNRKIIVLLICLIIIGNTVYGSEYMQGNKLKYDFEKGLDGFEVGYADLPSEKGTKEFYELEFKYSNIPVEGTNTKGMFLAGNNHSDDLFMYVYKDISDQTNFKPNTSYNITMTFKIATNEPAGSFGSGGAPGESVYVKGGVVTREPKPYIDNMGYYRMNIDKGNQSFGGKELPLIGNIAKRNGTSDRTYAFNTYEVNQNINVGSSGKAYILIGLDSGYEGITKIYISDIELEYSEK